MTREQFTRGWKRLCDAFDTKASDARASIYFEELEEKDGMFFLAAISKIINSQERFPTIAKIRVTIGEVTPNDRIVKQDCDVCDGYGRVFIFGVMYRADCPHSYYLSKQIKLAPKDEVGIAYERSAQRRDYVSVYGEENVRKWWPAR